ncbi:anthranilate synthase component II [Neobacillus sp. NPDC097160]|uniref:anthranilate synthase component II n=1 Tax=Neobacillus sp. NPDC097160 TaxID=3364298 RepID=UPI0037F3E8A6
MILVIDNYDSFTFNLVQYIRTIGEEVVVIRNDQLSLKNIEEMQPDHLLISPGPGNPDSAGLCLQIVKRFYQEIPILGVCLGHQIIAQAFGGMIKKALKPMHGKVSFISHDQNGVFRDIPSPFQVTRYHSLIVEESTLPSCLEISARSADGEIMAIRHKDYKIEGVQFHPESILTQNGLQLIQNFFKKECKNEKTTASLII